MDVISFTKDTVLSDIHLFLPNKRHLMVRLNAAEQPVFLSQYRILCDGEKWENNDTCCASNLNLSCSKQACGYEECEQGAEKIDVLRPEYSERQDGDELSCPEVKSCLLDEDGDLDVLRRPEYKVSAPENCLEREKVCPTILSKGEEFENEDEEQTTPNVIIIEHTMATPLEDVGKQVWRGAFLMIDYILSHVDLFKGNTVLELGAGTGIASIVMATVARRVYCTDVGFDLLSMCKRNVFLNKHLLEPVGAQVKVRELDWLRDDFCIDTQKEFSWTEDEVADLHDTTTSLISADVCYDDDLTDAFFRTAYRIMSNLRHPSTFYIAIEKRLNFTLRHMDISCEAYDHFRCCLRDLQNIVDGKMNFTVEPVKVNFPQFLKYERIEQLELWKITATVEA
uniref:Methyltransferase 22, Kin17 lysine n=1 Tax=Erpetoichthys calabaricus TaxID=27687 RepID=A0A8C4XEW4_ERPCA